MLTLQLVYIMLYLHPTMYLLIPILQTAQIIMYGHLHPTMYLLIRSRARTSYLLQRYLHPTMYLLIPPAEMQAFSSWLIYIPLCIY